MNSADGEAATLEGAPRPVVAILTCDCFDGWLEDIGVSIDSFFKEMMGTWWFNYLQALECSGVRAVLLCTSGTVRVPRSFIHRPTGCAVYLLPESRAYAHVQRWREHVMLWQGEGGAFNLARRVTGALLGLAASYLSTPLLSLAGVLKQENCSSLVVEQYEDPRFDLCVLLGRMTGVSIYGTSAAVQPPEKWWHRLYRPFRPLALRLCSGLAICSTHEVSRVLQRYDFPESKVARIAYPIDLDVWHTGNKVKARAVLGIPADARVAIYHGAIELRVKGLDLLVEAWAQLLRSREAIDLRLLVVGTGSDSLEFARLLRAPQMRGVQWLDEWVHDREVLRRYLVAADVYVFPSRGDAFGVSVIEAMACGLPIVAASAPGMRDVLEQGERAGGVLVPLGDAKAFGAALGRFIDDSRFARNLGERARQLVQDRFSMNGIGLQLRNFLLARG